jgi:hypothetical protein
LIHERPPVQRVRYEKAHEHETEPPRQLPAEAGNRCWIVETKRYRSRE